MKTDISQLRKDYSFKTLSVNDVNENPILQFKTWFEEAIDAKIIEPNAMVLSTVHQNRPSARVVLLKEIREEGFVFFTNYESKKGQELAKNPLASINFFWPDLERQIRIEGLVEKISEEDSNNYFQSRPLNSRIGAWVSPQSQTITERAWLESRESDFVLQFKDGEIPKPNNWGGYMLKPDYVEFWQGRPSRLHDRILYQKKSSWELSVLAP